MKPRNRRRIEVYHHPGLDPLFFTVLKDIGDCLQVEKRQGDMYFIPRAYPHHIEVFDAPDLHFCIFFDQPTPGDIGYRASISAYSREVLAATLRIHIDALPNFPFTKEDPLIVNRRNPLDAHAVGE